MDVVIIGGGVAGCVLADMLRSRGHRSLILEKDKQPGGMCKSYYKDGFTYEYGPHILAMHNCSVDAADYIKTKIDTIQTQLTTASSINGQLTFYPPSVHSADRLGIGDQVRDELNARPAVADETNFETYLMDRVGPSLYRLFFYDFTKKFWGIEPRKLSAEWAKTRHLGEKLDSKRMFFNDKWCSYPKRDWNELFSSLLRDQPILYDVEVECVGFEKQQVCLRDGGKLDYDLLISTMHIDRLFAMQHGELQYAGYRIEPVVIDRPCYKRLDNSPISMTYYPGAEEEYCRVTDYGTFQKKSDFPYSQGTILTYEFPDSSIRLYPYSDERNKILFERYLQDAAQQSRLVTFGRMGLYKYLTTDTTVEMALRFIPYIEKWTTVTPERRLKFYESIRGDWTN